jgi:hypothetical protein
MRRMSLEACCTTTLTRSRVPPPRR